MSQRRRSREFALQVLYQLEINRQGAQETLTQFQKTYLPKGERDEFLERLVYGVLEHRKEIDRLIKQYSKNWKLDRMPMVDRNILRLAIFELMHCEDIPPKVTLNEAIELGKKYGSEDSGRFVNGILDRIQNEVIKKPDRPPTSPSI